MKPVKLGKNPAVHDPKALRFGTYLKASALPYIPSAYHWGTGVPEWPVYLNDTLGCCTIAGAAHQAGVWTFKESGTELIMPDSAILTAYEAVSGYIPGNESTDNGADLNTVIAYWKKTGIGGSKIETSVTIEPGNNTEVEASIYILGGAYVGVQMPITAQAQSDKAYDTWALTPGYKTDPNAQPGSWGGHLVPAIGYSKTGLVIISWGMPFYMSWGFYDFYSDESFGLLSSEWVASGKVAPNHFDLAQLQEDMSSL